MDFPLSAKITIVFKPKPTVLNIVVIGPGIDSKVVSVSVETMNFFRFFIQNLPEAC